MELFNIVHIYSEKLIPVFIRIAAMLSFIPFIGGKTTPMMLKAGIVLALSLLVVPVAKVNTNDPFRSILDAIFVGIAMGLAVRIIFGAVEMAAQWISLQMGFGLAAVFNPQFGETMGPLNFFYMFLTMVFFFALDIHHHFIEGIVRSFDIEQVQYKNIFQTIINLNSLLFPLAFKIAAPVIVVQMLVNIAMGFLSKAMPQANIFFVSFPVLLGIGFIFIIASLSLTFMLISKAFLNMKEAIFLFTR